MKPIKNTTSRYVNSTKHLVKIDSNNQVTTIRIEQNFNETTNKWKHSLKTTRNEKSKKKNPISGYPK
nr:hypothetical protein [Mycoplasmopsis bovis]